MKITKLALALGFAVAGNTFAQDVLIHDATVHTAGSAGTLEHADVLVRGGKIAAVGANLAAAGATVVEANGRPVTPGLFGGLTGLGLEEVSLEGATVDSAYAPGAQVPPMSLEWRPEFDATLAFNPREAPIPVARVEGITFAMLAPGASVPGGNFVAGQGAAITLDGRWDAVLPASRSLFINIGSGAMPLAGGSRAAQYMLLEQALREAKPATAMRDGDYHLLTPAGRETLARYAGGGRVVFRVERAADIRQVLALSAKHGFKPVIVGGAEAWVVASDLARANVPVFVDTLVNLPGDFDQLGARLDNAALLDRAGVRVGFSQAGDATHNARKIRQLAGNAVAQGMRWDAALAGLTRVPADVFGLAQEGRIEVGASADLVLWSGDPLEITTAPEAVWIDGRAQSMRSRQTELRDRYLQRAGITPPATP